MHRAYYLSSNGRDFVSLDGDGAWIGVAKELRSREWSYDTGYRSLYSISRQVAKRKITAHFTALEIADKLRALSDYDVAHTLPGWIVIDADEVDGVLVSGWRQRAYIVSSEPDVITRTHLATKLTIMLLDGSWMRSNLIQLRREKSYGTEGLDYPHDIPFDYGIDISTKYINNIGVSEAPVKLTFYGSGANPQVTIGNNTYKVNVTIPESCYVVADGANYPKTIKLTDPYGDVEDIFDKGVRSSGRGSGEYIFEQVPVGYFPISWSGASAVDVEWFEVEGEPPWS